MVAEWGGQVELIQGDDAVNLWEANGTDVSISFPVGLPQSAFNLTVAKDDTGEFVVDAVATDGGFWG